MRVWWRWVEFTWPVFPLQRVVVREDGRDRTGVVGSVDCADRRRARVVFSEPEDPAQLEGMLS